MDDYNLLARKLDTAYLLATLFQMAAIIAAVIGPGYWKYRYGIWLTVAGWVGIVICAALRWYIKVLFRRHWPIE